MPTRDSSAVSMARSSIYKINNVLPCRTNRSWLSWRNELGGIKGATSWQNSSLSSTAILNSAPHSPSLPNQVEENDNYDFVGAKDAATNGPIDWDFGRAETDEFLRRRRGRKSLPIVHHHGFVCEIPPNHRFVMGKFDGLYNYLMMDGVVEKEQVVIVSGA